MIEDRNHLKIFLLQAINNCETSNNDDTNVPAIEMHLIKSMTHEDDTRLEQMTWKFDIIARHGDSARTKYQQMRSPNL